MVRFLAIAFLAPALSFAGSPSRILIVGDSHTAGPFGLGLLSALDSQPNLETALYASCGSRAEHWTGTPYSNRICSREKDYSQAKPVDFGAKDGSRPMKSLSALVSAGKPDVVVLALGTNSLPTDREASLDRAKKEVVRAIESAKSRGARCIWVGPPNEPTERFPKSVQDCFSSMLRTTVEANGCRFVDSRDFTNAADTALDRSSHLHYYGRAGTKWGEAVGGKIVCDLRPSPQNCGGGSGGGGLSGGTTKGRVGSGIAN